ncbi:Uncharacterised protein [Bordetella pertussis]|nr:Uncharacterised protein [Bordetella pertussis]CPM66910.1 Uncharacterised protein [Bordetella pertussis]
MFCALTVSSPAAHSSAFASLATLPCAELSVRSLPTTMACLLSIFSCTSAIRLPGLPVSISVVSDLALTRNVPSATGRI